MANYNQNQTPFDNRMPSGRANNRGSAMPPNGGPGPQSPNTGGKPSAARTQKPLANNILGNLGNLGNMMNAGLGGSSGGMGGLGALGSLLGGGGGGAGGLGALGSILGGGAGADGLGALAGLLGGGAGGLGALGSILGGGAGAGAGVGGLGALGSLLGSGAGAGAGGLGNLGAIASLLGNMGNVAPVAGTGTGTEAGSTPAAATPDLSGILSALGNINAAGGVTSGNNANPLGNLSGPDLLSKLSDLLANINSAPANPQTTAQSEEARPGPGAAPDKEIIVGSPSEGETGPANQIDAGSLAPLLAAALGKLGNISGSNQQQNNMHKANFAEHTNNQQGTQTDYQPDPEPIIETNTNISIRLIYSDKLTDEPYDPCSNCPHPCWHSKQHLPSFNEVLKMTANWNRY